MKHDPVEVLEAMAMRAAVARRVAESESLFLRERRVDDPLAHARVDVRIRLAYAAATIGLRWLRTLEAEGLAGGERGAAIRADLQAVADARRLQNPPTFRTDMPPDTLPGAPHADFDATFANRSDRASRTGAEHDRA